MPQAADSDRFVQPNTQRGGWDVVKGDHQRVSAHTRTKDEAINRARQIITNLGGGELRIKNEQGLFIDSDTITGARRQPESLTRDTR